MAISFVPASLNPTPSKTFWGIVLLEHLDEFATLAWYLVADGKLVGDTFSRTLTTLDTIPFEASMPALTYSQARDVLIAQAIAVVSDMRIEEARDWPVEPNSIDRLPDRFEVVRSSFCKPYILGLYRYILQNPCILGRC
jgi:hypothetical protein